ncbi:hypothetical protein IAG41_12040 [Sphingomonas sp. JC676]|uniref:tetratricopeptide repeat protein n=1 Tax=Sphingomonas sp. JC676 TaxID=2768065 RepID=UPI0016583F7A|nr:hypothetical protein [Sphingomonas sp. JC676]MBC9033120.1 hypothetical protein [Sphingomonas sp. JC676]
MLRRLLFVASLVAPSVAHAQWSEASSSHFVVYSEGAPEKLRAFTDELERFDQALRIVTGTPDRPISPNARVTVFFVDNVSTIEKLIDRRNIAGFFKARASGSVAFVPRSAGGGGLGAREILQHEYAHNFMFSSWPGVVFAPWFIEGFAEFVATATTRTDGSVVIGRSPSYRAGCIDRAGALPARQLVKLDPGKLSDEQTCVLYARGWLLTHYLIRGGHADQLAQYIGAINANKSIEEATQALGDLDSLDSKLTVYAKRSTLTASQVDADKLKVGKIAIRQLTAGEAAVMPARILSENGVDEAAAKTTVDLARRLAAPYPNDAGAQNELAEAEYDAGNYAAAEAAANRALGADPKSVHALLYKGMAQTEIARKASETDPAKWRAIRQWFITANKADTEYAEPLIQYYYSFHAAKQAPPKSALDGLIYAYALAPYDRGLRMNAGIALLEKGNAKAARIAFEPVAYGPHRSGESNLAADIITALDEKGTEGALAVIRGMGQKPKPDASTEPKKGA